MSFVSLLNKPNAFLRLPMSQLSRELAAIGRIVRAIKSYRQTLPDRQMDSRESTDTYLKQQLSVRDWLFWKQLQEKPNEPLVEQKEFPSEKALTPQQFSFLLGQYKQAGFESYQVWCQSQPVVAGWASNLPAL